MELNFSGKNIAVAGFGDEGQIMAGFFTSKGASVTVLDENEELKAERPAEYKFVLGASAFNDLSAFDLVCRSPGIRPDALSSATNLTSQTKLFFDLCKSPIIGVTGTKGKGTTVSLIADILKKSGRAVHVVGNIGYPAMTKLEEISADDIVVYELSSFQLWDLEKSPHVAVVLMIDTDHLDVHTDMREYVDAKSSITKHQEFDDIVIYHPVNQFAGHLATMSKGKKYKFLTAEGAYIKDGNLMISDQVIMPVTDFGLIGSHNHENIAAAVTAAWTYTHDIKAIASAVAGFKGLEHRLEFVAQKKNVAYINDSFSTTPLAAIAALKSFSGPKVMITGGASKKASFRELAREFKEANLRAVVVIGEEGQRIKEELKYSAADRYIIVDGGHTMDEIVNQAVLVAQPGDTVVLSPACSSFDMFESYKQRGAFFKESVAKLED